MNIDDGPLSDLNRTDPWLAAITPERIAKALAGFPLSLAHGWDLRRLAGRVQDAANYSRGKPPQSDADAKAKLERLAQKAAALRKEMAHMGETAEIAVFWEVFRHLGESANAGRVDYNDDYKPLMLHPLETIANVLARSASQIGTQRKQAPGWRKKDDQDRRVGFAIELTPVFQDSFNTLARANNWRADFGKEHPWPEFYRRIYGELFPQAKRLNLSEVLQEAARQMPNVEAMERWLDKQEATRSENIDK